MTVLVTAEVAGQTPQGYDGMLGALRGRITGADGFIAHASHQVEGGWRVIEVWESKAQADRFFAREVAPNLPPGIHPKRVTQELHSWVTPPIARALS
jgi:hypothetical protein